MEFYTSGRASNRAAYLYQLFAREYGTNNFPDCSNMCHEPTSVGLPQSIGIGKGTVSLEDFDACDLILSIGHNPGTNHPRMMGTLHEASRRNVPIIVFNPLRERALERFADPQNWVEMATYGSTRIASTYFGQCRRRRGGAQGHHERPCWRWRPTGRRARPRFHRRPYDRLRSLRGRHGRDHGRTSRSQRAEAGRLEQVAIAYAKAKATIVTYGMGITQHNKGTAMCA